MKAKMKGKMRWNKEKSGGRMRQRVEGKERHSNRENEERRDGERDSPGK